MSTGAAAIAVLPMLAIAFIAQRYLADFVPLLVLGAVLGVPAVASWAAVSSRRAGGVLGAVVLGVVGLVTNAGLPCWRNLYLLPDVDAAGLRGAAVRRPRRPGQRCPGRAACRTARRRRSGRGDRHRRRLRCGLSQRRRNVAVARAATRRGWRVVVEGSAIGPVVLGDGWQIDLVTDGTDRRLEYIGPTTVPGDVLPKAVAHRRRCRRRAPDGGGARRWRARPGGLPPAGRRPAGPRCGLALDPGRGLTVHRPD